MSDTNEILDQPDIVEWLQDHPDAKGRLERAVTMLEDKPDSPAAVRKLLPALVDLEYITGGLSYGGQEYAFGKSTRGFYFYRRFNRDQATKSDSLIIIAPKSVHAAVQREFEAFFSNKYPQLEISTSDSRDYNSYVRIESQISSNKNLDLPGLKFSISGPPATLDDAIADFLQLRPQSP